MSGLQINEELVFDTARRITDKALRADYVAQVCLNSPAIKARVLELLELHEEEVSLFDRPVGGLPQTLLADQVSESAGAQIGPYKLLQKIGEGGMGVVYMAEQTKPVERRVALKIIKPGMDTKQVIARFEAERQALAMMDHPNIAKVLDAGETASGRPYFVMELVKGVPITEYCDEHHANPKQRLELFLSVLHAVQHAHQKGIIHRDLKPSNVLVAEYDNRAVPKVIDFGVAKATSQKLTDKTMFTQYGQLVGTFEYMSPEQSKLNQMDIDTRSDVYSLGVLLYELLAGDTPFDRQRLRSAAFDELLRIIREEDPPRPSTRLSTSATLAKVSANRSVEPKKLSTLIRGELDWIVMKAMDKDRGRRYETASAFAADVERHLHNEPVEACPPSTVYRFRKFVSHNRVAFTTGSLVASALLVGLITSVFQAVRLDRERQRAETALLEAETARQSELEQRQAVVKERDEAQRQRDQVAGLNQTLRDQQEQQRRISYTRDMRLVQASWNAGNVGQVREVLAGYRPKSGELDLRGFEWNYWNRQTHAETRTFQILKGNAPALKLSLCSDGSRIAQIDDLRKTITIWSVETGHRLQTIASPDDQAEGPIFLDTAGKRLAISWGVATQRSSSFGMSKRLQVFDVDTGRPRYSIHEPLGLLSTSPDGSRMAAIVSTVGGKADSQWAIKIWDGDSGDELFANPLAELPNSIAVAPQGTKIAMSYDGPSRVELMSFEKNSEKGFVSLTKPQVGQMRFSSNGTQLVLAQSDGLSLGSDINVYDLTQPGERRPLHVFGDGSGRAIAVSADGRWLAYERAGFMAIQVVNLSDGSRLPTLQGHTAILRNLAFSADSRRLISTDLYGTVKEWSMPNVETLNVGSVPNTLALASDQSWIAVASQATPVASGVLPRARIPSFNRVTVHGLHGQGTRHLPPLDGSIELGELSFSQNGERLAVAAVVPDEKLSQASDVRVFDTASGRELLSQRLPAREGYDLSSSYRSFACSIALSPDGQRLAVTDFPVNGPAKHPLRLLDIDTREEAQSFESISFGAEELLWSPNSRWIAASSNDDGYISPRSVITRAVRTLGGGSIAVWDAETGRIACQLKEDSSFTRSVQFCPDGDWLLGAIFSRNSSAVATGIRVWEASTGKVVHELQFPACIGFYSYDILAMSSDRQRIAISAKNGGTQARLIVVWDLGKPEQPVLLKGHIGMIGSLDFSPNTSRLASSSLGQATSQTKIWDVATGEELLSENDGQLILKFDSRGEELLGIRAENNGEIVISRWDSSPPLPAVEAQHLVAAMMNRVQTELPTSSELVAEIEADTSLSNELRAAAVTAMRQWPRQPELLQAAWSRLRLAEPTSQDLERALAYLADVRISEPQNTSAWLASALAYHQLNRLSDARTALSQYRKSLVKSTGPSENQAELIQAILSEFPFEPSRRPEQPTGIAEMTRIIAAEPNWSVPYFARAFRQATVGEYPAALESLNIGLKLEPESIWGLNARAWLLATCPDSLVRNGKQAVADALKLSTSTAEKTPEYLNTYAAALAERGDFDAAVKQQELALSLASPVDLDAYRLRLQLYRHSRPFRELPFYWYQRSEEAQSRFDAASDLKRQGNLVAALKEYQTAIEINTKEFFPVLHLRHGQALLDLNRFEEALVEFQKVIEIDPSHIEGNNDFGRVLMGQGKLDEAAAQFRLTNDLDPEYVWAHYNLGITFERQGKWQEALGEYRIAAQLAPEEASPHNVLAWTLVTLRDEHGKFLDIEEGLKAAQRACELAPSDGNYQNTLGVAYYRHEQWQLAIDALKKSVELGNDEVINWLFLAMSELRLGNLEQAHAWYDKALAWRESNELDAEQKSFFAEAEAAFQTDTASHSAAEDQKSDSDLETNPKDRSE